IVDEKISLVANSLYYKELANISHFLILSAVKIYIAGSVKDLEKPNKGDKIPRGTKTELLAASPGRVSSGERLYDETDFRDWLDCKRSKEAAEEAIGLGKYGKVLTVIS
ncbi:MAG: hypothetical protein LBQ88_05730, partial [Treponema sp.]|nr:hypothetical protein [Treponema sp.]